jgi:coenzyme PQQ synthesis protein D (PqqD)
MVESPSRVVVLDLTAPETATPLAMEGSAYAIWQELAVPSTTDQVLERVAAAFGVPRAELEPDVLSFLDVLESRGLASRSPRGVADTGPRPTGPCS